MRINLLNALPLLLSSSTLAQVEPETEPPLLPSHPCVASLPAETPPCYSNLDDIWCSEWQVPQDQTVIRRYYLCPGEYLIGQPTDQSNASAPYIGGQRPIFLTPNMEVVCGEDGVPSPDCVLSGGPSHLQVNGIPGSPGEIGNILLEGITFNGAQTFTFAAGFGLTQNLTFKNCAFINNYNAFVFQVFNDPTNANSLTYTLEDVVFENNAVVQLENQAGILVMDHQPSTLVLKNVIFRNNVAFLQGNELGFAVSSTGELEMNDVCFIDNLMFGAPVISISANTNSTNVYSTPDTSLECPNAAQITATNGLECTFPLDSNFCTVIGMTESPTLTPTIEPSSGPSVRTEEPSVAPTVASSANRSTAVLAVVGSVLALLVV